MTTPAPDFLHHLLSNAQFGKTPVGSPQAPLFVPQPDFIDAYTAWADVFELPPETHEAIATAQVAALLNRQGVVLEHGGRQIPLDWWTVLLSPSGGGRNTALHPLGRLLDEAGIADLEKKATWGSPQAAMQQIAENPTGLYTWPELSVVLKKLNEPRFSGFKEWLTDLYDELRIPHTQKYRATGKGGTVSSKDTPPIEFRQAPRINVLATSSEAWFQSNINPEDATGGFLPRWTIFKLPDSTRDIPETEPLDSRKLLPILVKRVQQIARVQGTAWLTAEARQRYDKWYRATRQRFRRAPNRALAEAFFNRHRTHVLKLAVIFEISQSTQLVVSEDAMGRAIATARQLERTIFGLLPTGMSQFGAQQDRIVKLVRKGGATGISGNILVRGTQDMKPADREQALRTLWQAHTVSIYERRGGRGRPATIYVHEAFLKRFEKKHRQPNDTEKLYW